MDNQSLKILITDPHLRGGGQVRYVTNLAGELTRLGHQVLLACRAGSVLVDRAREIGVPVFENFWFRGGLRPRSWEHDFNTMRTLIRKHQPDILHVSGSQDHWIAAIANWAMGRPVALVRTRHNTYRVHDHWANRVLNCNLTDYQIVVCDVVRRTLAEQKSFDAARMVSIHNGVDAERFKPSDGARHEIRNEFGYKDEDLVLGIAARLVEDKGHRFLLEAVSQLKNEFPQFRLLILGEGPLDTELKLMAQRFGIDRITHFAGFRDDMHHCVQAIDIGVQPSIGCDTSSFSLKEQMAAGKPVVASDYGGLAEIVRPGIDGFVVPAGTVEPLAEAISKLLRDSALRENMGQAGRQRVQEEFTVQVYVQRTVEAYRRAIEVHRERLAHR